MRTLTVLPFLSDDTELAPVPVPEVVFPDPGSEGQAEASPIGGQMTTLARDVAALLNGLGLAPCGDRIDLQMRLSEAVLLPCGGEGPLVARVLVQTTAGSMPHDADLLPMDVLFRLEPDQDLNGGV